MKKFTALLCMITCIFCLTACGEETLTTYEQSKLAYAEDVAVDSFIPLLTDLASAGEDLFDGYTSEEIEYIIGNSYSLNVEGNAVNSALTSFVSGLSEIGTIVSTGDVEAEIDDDQIIVTVDVTGTKKSGEVEIILSNDMFFVLESATLNPSSSIGELMITAVMNMLIGMGTVFVVLLLICGLIYLFRFIPKIQEKFSKKQPAATPAPNKPVPAPAPVAALVAEAEEETDDLELVAVIAAAIAASEGASSTDGFVVRSIRKAGRSRR